MRASRLVLLLSAYLLPLAGCAGGSRTSDAGVDAGSTATLDAGPGVAVCGDLVCSEGSEDCESCAIDCGECPTCDLAPTCTGAIAAPTMTTPLDECSNTLEDDDRTNYVCGVGLGVSPDATDCADPQLRLRVREIEITRGWFDISRHLYCVISAEDGEHSELLVTPPRQVAGNQNTTNLNYTLSDGIFWGQADLYRSVNNVTVTYACYLTSDVEAAMRVLDDIADRAGESAEYAGAYGWVFGAVSVVGGLISSSLAGTPDKQIVDVQQTIDRGALLDLTNGRTFEIRTRDGNLSLSGAHDIRIQVEAWGCADVRTTFD